MLSDPATSSSSGPIPDEVCTMSRVQNLRSARCRACKQMAQVKVPDPIIAAKDDSFARMEVWEASWLKLFLLKAAIVQVVDLDVDLLLKNLRTSRQGAAAGPSGTTTEHPEDLVGQRALFGEVAILFAGGQIPPECQSWENDRSAKAGWGVRGIVVGDVMRRFVARTSLSNWCVWGKDSSLSLTTYVVCSRSVFRTKTGHQHSLGEDKLWNLVAESLAEIQKEKPEAVVWRGDLSLPAEKQGLTALGGPSQTPGLCCQ